MKKHIIYILVILLVVGGNVFQFLNPRERVEVKWKEKVITKTKTRTVYKYREDGSLESKIESIDEDIEKLSDLDKVTEPKPLPLNGTYLAINPFVTTQLGLVQTRKLLGPVNALALGVVDLATIAPQSQVNAFVMIGAGLEY